MDIYHKYPGFVGDERDAPIAEGVLIGLEAFWIG